MKETDKLILVKSQNYGIIELCAK